jgi:RNA polymerase sigma factor (sigma-70 family)
VGEAVGEETDFDLFYREHFRRLVVSLRLAAGGGSSGADDAEDLAQEAFARTLPRWDRVRIGTNPAGYVYRVAFRLHERRLARQRRWQRVAGLLRTRASRRRAVQPTAPGDVWADVDGIRAALAGLPPGCRRAAALCLYVEMTPVEAAEVLGVSPSTVRTQLQRARTVLAAAIALPSDDEAASVATSATPIL